MSTVELSPVDDVSDAEIVRLYMDEGMLIPEISERVGLSRAETMAALDRGLPRIDANFKRRQIAVATRRLEEMHRAFHKRAMDEGDNEAAHISIRASCEMRAWLGVGGAGFDPTQLLANADPSSQAGTPAAYQAVLARLVKPSTSSE
jgi:hypothetical protein